MGTDRNASPTRLTAGSIRPRTKSQPTHISPNCTSAAFGAGGGSKSATKLRHAFPCEPIFLTAPKRSSPEIGHMPAGCAVALSQYFAKARRDTAVAYGAVGVRITSVNGTQRKSRDVAVPTALGCEDEIYEPFLYDPNLTFAAIRRTVELVGEGNPLERG